MADGMQAGNDVVAGVRDEEPGAAKGVGNEFQAMIDKRRESVTRAGADENAVAVELARTGQMGFVGGVGFVEDGDDAFFVGAEFLEHGEGGGVVRGDVGRGDVEDVYQEIRYNGFLERGFEGFDEAVREAADEAHGVGNEEFLVAAQEELAGGGVEGGEEFVLGEDVGAGEGVDEGGFAGVGVADNGGGGHGHALAFVALHGALLANFGQLFFEARDAVAHEAAVLFELGFAFAAHLAFAALAREVRPGAGEAGEGIFHAREGDLEDGFARLGAVGKDVEDDFFAVNDGDAGEFFPVALLGGREVVVDHNQVAFERFGPGDEFVGFAAAEECTRRGTTEVDECAFDDADVEVFDELLEFVEQFFAFVGLHLRGLHSDEEGAFAAFVLRGGCFF